MADYMARQPCEYNNANYLELREVCEKSLTATLLTIVGDPDSSNHTKAEYMTAVTLGTHKKRADSFKSIAPKASFITPDHGDYSDMTKNVQSALDSDADIQELIETIVKCYVFNLSTHEVTLIEKAPRSIAFRLKQVFTESAPEITKIAAGAFIGSLLANRIAKNLDR